MDLSKDYSIVKYCPNSVEEKLDSVVVEYQLSVFIDGENYKRILCSPESIKELIVGRLFTEEKIGSMDDVLEIIISLPNKSAMVSLRPVYRDELILDEQVKSVKSDDQEMPNALNYQKLRSLFSRFVGASKLFETTGGVHSCAICDGEEILYRQDDIGRQNALDKVIGSCVLNDIPLKNKIMFTSCRISSEIMIKVINSGIRVLMSKSAPTDVAVDMAKEKGVTLIGFVRGERMNIYERGYYGKILI